MTLQRATHCFLRRVALAAATVALAVPGVNAAPIVFRGLDNTNSVGTGPGPNSTLARMQFVNALGAASISTQDFESFGVGSLPLGDTNGVFANGVGVTLNNSASQYVAINDSVGAFNTFATSPTKYLETLSEENSTYFTATFTQAVRGIGFFVTDPSDWVGTSAGVTIERLQVVLTTMSGMSVVLDLTPDTPALDPHNLVDGNIAFFGVVDGADPFTSIAIRSGNAPDEDALGFDDVMISISAVPVPGTLPLVLGLLPLLGLMRRRSG